MPFPPDSNTDKRYVSCQKAQSIYDVSDRTLQRRAADGLLSRHYRKGRVYYLKSELDALFPKKPQPEDV